MTVRIIRLSLLLILGAPMLALANLTAININSERIPAAFESFDANKIHSLTWSGISAKAAQGTLELTVGSETTHRLHVASQMQHANGDFSLNLSGSDGLSGMVTIGDKGVFGRLSGPHHDYWLTSDGNGSWLLQLPDQGIAASPCGVTEPHFHAPPTPSAQAKGGNTLIDILVIHTQDLADRFPGDLVDTRINQYIAVSNQAFANSGLPLTVRLVGNELVGYTDDNNNGIALNDMSIALQGGTVTGLESLADLRAQTGADLVIMVRPHSIEIRGSCGIANFPTGDPTLGVNVVSEGMSSWSLCDDATFPHEIGHNLGAGHQVGRGGGAFEVRGAAYTFNNDVQTVMGSFGTGEVARSRGVNNFSSPLIQCAGRPCGFDVNSPLPADNVAVMSEQMLVVSTYLPATSSLPAIGVAPNNDDSDGDGVFDADDFFPFDPTEQDDSDLDGAGDNSDAFPNDASESLDTDGDGTGNNADSDDDGDGTVDIADFFDDDPSEQRNSDRDLIGDNADAFPNDRLEWADADGDGTGDNADLDDDNDGIDDRDPIAEDLLVISAGNNRVLRFDGDTGESRGVEVTPEGGLVTFQSDIVYNPNDHRFFLTTLSNIARFDPVSRQQVDIYVPGFSQTGGLQLSSGFPTSLLYRDGLLGVSLQGRTAALFYEFDQPRLAALSQLLPTQVIDMVADSATTGFALDPRTRAIYRTMPAADGTFFLSGPGAAWMQDARELALRDDRLLVVDRGRNAVVALDAASGAFLGNFITFNGTGASGPTGIAIDRNGDVYVSSQTDDQVLRFDGDSGELIDVFVPAGAGGLDGPARMTFVPRLLDRFPATVGQAIRPNGGLWFNPATNGRGFDIQIFGARLSAIWYTYDENGLPTWYFSAGDLVDFVYQADLTQLTLTPEGAVINVVGTITLTFESERQAQLDWTIGADSGGEPLQWLVFDDPLPSTDNTGLWGREDGPGWGLSLATQGDQTVAIAFVYDDDGNPRWVISDPAIDAAELPFTMNAVMAPHLCPTCDGQGELTIIDAGTMTVGTGDMANWISEVVYPEGIPGGWNVDIPIVRFSEEPQRPR